jgi:hypothetical protein
MHVTNLCTWLPCQGMTGLGLDLDHDHKGAGLICSTSFLVERSVHVLGLAPQIFRWRSFLIGMQQPDHSQSREVTGIDQPCAWDWGCVQTFWRDSFVRMNEGFLDIPYLYYSVTGEGAQGQNFLQKGWSTRLLLLQFQLMLLSSLRSKTQILWDHQDTDLCWQLRPSDQVSHWGSYCHLSCTNWSCSTIPSQDWQPASHSIHMGGGLQQL